MDVSAPSTNQKKIIWFGVTALALAVIVAVIVGAVWGLGQALSLLAPVIWPLAVAGVLAYLLDPVVDWIEHRGVPRTRAILLVFFVAAGLLLAVLASIVPRLVVETKELADKVPEYTQRIQQWAKNSLANPPALVKQFLPFLLPKPHANEAAPGTTPPIDQKTIASISDVLATVLPTIGDWIVTQFSKALSLF